MNKQQANPQRRLGPSAEKFRKFGDPAHIGPRGKNRSERRSRSDPGWTPSEQRMRSKLMKQFARLDGPSGNSQAYLESSIWCACGFGMNRRALDGSTVACVRCAPDAQVEQLGHAHDANDVEAR